MFKMGEKTCLLQALLCFHILVGLHVEATDEDFNVTLRLPGDSQRLKISRREGEVPGTSTLWELAGPPGTQLEFYCTGLHQTKEGQCLPGVVWYEDGRNYVRRHCVNLPYRKRSLSHQMKVFLGIDVEVEGLKCTVRLLSTDPKSSFSDLKPTSCVCGRRNKDGEFTFKAYLRQSNSRALCGGAILTERHVLTAASCIEKYDFKNVEVVVGGGGENNLTQNFSILSTIVHENYTREQYSASDIALLRLSADIHFNERVGPVCLPSEQYDLLHMWITAIGWSDGLPPALEEAEVQVFPLYYCNIPKRPGLVNLKNITQLCTLTDVSETKTTYFRTCQTAAGSPLLHWDPDLQRYVLVGFFSFLSHSGEYRKSLRWVINTNVFSHFKWIQKKIAQNTVKTSKDTKRYQTCKKL